MKKHVFFIVFLSLIASIALVFLTLPPMAFAGQHGAHNPYVHHNRNHPYYHNWDHHRSYGPNPAAVLFGVADIIRAANPPEISPCYGGGPVIVPSENPYNASTKVWVPPIRERVWVAGYMTPSGRWMKGYWSTQTVRPGYWASAP